MQDSLLNCSWANYLELPPAFTSAPNLHAAQVPILETRKPRHRKNVVELGQIWGLATKSRFIARLRRLKLKEVHPGQA